MRKIFSNIWNIQIENKNTTNEFRYFLEPNFVGVSRLFALLYINKDTDSKRFKAKRYCLPKDITKNHIMWSSMGKNFMSNPLIEI